MCVQVSIGSIRNQTEERGHSKERVNGTPDQQTPLKGPKVTVLRGHKVDQGRHKVGVRTPGATVLRSQGSEEKVRGNEASSRGGSLEFCLGVQGYLEAGRGS